MKRKIFMLISGLIILFALVAVFIFMNLDTYIKNAIEKYGSAITGTRVTVSKVEISPTSGEGAMNYFTIANPRGFKNDYAFTLNRTSVSVDMKTVTSDKVIIEEVVMDGPSIVFEVNQNGNNYAVIRKNVNDYLAKSDSGSSDGRLANTQIVIKDFYVRNGKIKVVAPMLGQSFDVALPTIHLTDVGANGGKGNASQVIQQLMTVITSSVVSAVGPVTIQNFTTFLGNTVGGTAGGVLKGTGDVAEEAGSIVEGIFGGGSKK